MGNIICDNYYCQPVSFKPEWFSESSWNIEYDNPQKPYIIDKGIIKINNISPFNMILSKKLLINLNEIKLISIPINFKYNIKNNSEIIISIILNDKQINLNDIYHDVNNNILNINLKLHKKKCIINEKFNHKINLNKLNTFTIDLENNFNLMLIKEKLYDNTKNIYENKYLKQFNNINDNIYLNIIIEIKNELVNTEYIELNFE